MFPGLVYPDELEVRFLANSPSYSIEGVAWADRMLLREFRAVWDEGEVVAPAGFIYDGASIPGPAQGLFQKQGSWMRPSVIHDWLYDQKDSRGRGFADDLLEASLEAAGTPAWGRFWFMRAVRTFGQAAWDD